MKSHGLECPEFATIGSIEFGVMRDIDVEKQFHGREITVPTLYQTNTNIPLEHGPLCTKMGSPRRGIDCATCGGNFKSDGEKTCPGHHGFMKLAWRVYIPTFVPTILKTLNSVCDQCRKLVLKQSEITAARLINENQARFRYITDICLKRSGCPTCSGVVDDSVELGAIFNPVILKKKKGKVYHRKRYDLDGKYEICRKFQKNYQGPRVHVTTEEVYYILEDLISPDTIKLLGLSTHPKYFVPGIIPILPNPLRPSSCRGEVISEHSLTLCIAELARVNNVANDMVKRSARVESLLREQAAKLQSAYVAMFHGAEKTQFETNASARRYRVRGPISSKQGTARKGILDNFKHKEGQMRGEGMGKRVNWCGRSVITADCKIAIGEFGVPYSVAATLTFPEIVNQHNIAVLTECVARGWQPVMGNKPGAMFHISARTGQRKCLAYYAQSTASDANDVKCGDTVERTMMTGDMVLVNRQPSLHKWSMMAHKVILMPGSSFRLNPSVTSPYGADFDGDEMNIHLPQTYAAQAELRELMAVQFGIVSAQKSAPVIGVIQDVLVGSYLLTEPGVLIDEQTMMNCLSELEISELPIPAIMHRQPDSGRWIKYWTGHQLFSCLFPADLSCDERSNKDVWDQHSNGMVICGGTLVLGRMSKKTLGASAPHSIAHILYLDHSPAVAAKFLSEIQYVVNRWLQTRGFSVGLRDMILSSVVREKVETELKELGKKLEDPEQGLLRKRTLISRNDWENSMMLELDYVRDKLCLQINNAVVGNSLHSMVAAGSKGNPINQMQIMGFIGQQSINGKRIQPKFGKRTLPHFECGDVGSDGCGFVRNSFLSGLLPAEFFFHMAGSRVGIVDTACKTEKSGYVGHREVKVLEDYNVDQLGGVRGTKGRVLQFVYGDDGFDAQFLEKCRVILRGMTRDEFLERFICTTTTTDDNCSEYLKNCAESYCNENLRNPEACVREYTRLESEWRWINTQWRPPRDTGVDNVARIAMPVDIDRLLFCASKRVDKAALALDEDDVITEAEELIEELLKHSESTYMIYITNLQAGLASKNVVHRYKLTRGQFDWLKFQIRDKVARAKIAAGSPVGVDAGHGISEPSTQMTLRTFHHAGMTQEHVILGIPGLEQLLACSANPKSSVVTCQIGTSSPIDAMTVIGQIQCKHVRDIIDAYELRYIPTHRNEVINSAELFPDELDALEMMEALGDVKKLSDWVFVCEMRSQTSTLNFCGESSSALERRFGDTLFHTMRKDQFAVYIRCVVSDTDADENTIKWAMDTFIPTLLKLPVTGISGASNVYEDKGKLSICGKVSITDVLLSAADDENMIDENTVTSNAMYDVLDTLGIEAAREAIIRRAWDIFSFDGNPPSLRHMAMLADFMTHSGKLTSVSRHGMSMNVAGPLARASFENQTEVMTSSAQFGAIDDSRDVSSCILTGKNVVCGTGNIDILLDSETLSMSDARVYGETREPQAVSPGFAHTPYIDLRATSPFGVQTPCRSIPASTPMFTNSGMYSPSSPDYSEYIRSPGWSPATSPFSQAPNYAASSPRYTDVHSPESSPTSPNYSPLSPIYKAASPNYCQTSPTSQLNSPAYSPSSPYDFEF